MGHLLKRDERTDRDPRVKHFIPDTWQVCYFFFVFYCFYLQVYKGQAKKYHTIILVLQFYIKKETKKERMAGML